MEGFIMTVTICIGSSCHLKGSREIIQKLQELVCQNHLEEKVDLNGSFCTGNCVKGVCVTVDGELFSLKPEDTETFFEEKVLGRLG
jgi:NADH:ubiquinone oxidoreductase subunit E